MPGHEVHVRRLRRLKRGFIAKFVIDNVGHAVAKENNNLHTSLSD
jgi:hypothetical protein